MKNQTHLAQTLQSMRAAQNHLQAVHHISRQMRAALVAGADPAPLEGMRRALRNGRETQEDELAMASQCLRTMYPAANEPQFRVAL